MKPNSGLLLLAREGTLLIENKEVPTQRCHTQTVLIVSCKWAPGIEGKLQSSPDPTAKARACGAESAQRAVYHSAPAGDWPRGFNEKLFIKVSSIEGSQQE